MPWLQASRAGCAATDRRLLHSSHSSSSSSSHAPPEFHLKDRQPQQQQQQGRLRALPCAALAPLPPAPAPPAGFHQQACQAAPTRTAVTAAEESLSRVCHRHPSSSHQPQLGHSVLNLPILISHILKQVLVKCASRPY